MARKSSKGSKAAAPAEAPDTQPRRTRVRNPNVIYFESPHRSPPTTSRLSQEPEPTVSEQQQPKLSASPEPPKQTQSRPATSSVQTTQSGSPVSRGSKSPNGVASAASGSAEGDRGSVGGTDSSPGSGPGSGPASAPVSVPASFPTFEAVPLQREKQTSQPKAGHNIGGGLKEVVMEGTPDATTATQPSIQAPQPAAQAPQTLTTRLYLQNKSLARANSNLNSKVATLEMQMCNLISENTCLRHKNLELQRSYETWLRSHVNQTVKKQLKSKLDDITQLLSGLVDDIRETEDTRDTLTDTLLERPKSSRSNRQTLVPEKFRRRSSSARRRSSFFGDLPLVEDVYSPSVEQLDQEAKDVVLPLSYDDEEYMGTSLDGVEEMAEERPLIQEVEEEEGDEPHNVQEKREVIEENMGDEEMAQEQEQDQMMEQEVDQMAEEKEEEEHEKGQEDLKDDEHPVHYHSEVSDSLEELHSSPKTKAPIPTPQLPLPADVHVTSRKSRPASAISVFVDAPSEPPATASRRKSFTTNLDEEPTFASPFSDRSLSSSGSIRPSSSRRSSFTRASPRVSLFPSPVKLDTVRADEPSSPTRVAKPLSAGSANKPTSRGSTTVSMTSGKSTKKSVTIGMAFNAKPAGGKTAATPAAKHAANNKTKSTPLKAKDNNSNGAPLSTAKSVKTKKAPNETETMPMTAPSRGSSRRSRAAPINYALPRINSKLRRDQVHMVDAVFEGTADEVSAKRALVEEHNPGTKRRRSAI